MRAVAAAVANLERHVDEVDSLNVFPVPDGDTGSNMLATMKAAIAEAERVPESGRELYDVADALSRGALVGARGNSGVILSQIIRGMTDGVDDRRRASGLDLARGLRRGSEVAYGAVLTPVEGTMLTVIRDAAEAAEAAAARGPRVEAVLTDVIEAAAASVARTPTLLPILDDAGVVDSGGQGLFRLLEGAIQMDGSTESRPAPEVPRVGGRAHPTQPTANEPVAASVEGGLDFGYEAEFMLHSAGDALDIAAIREELQSIGESVIVAGDGRSARVHVHGLRPDLAIGIGLRSGKLSAVEIRDLDAQAARHAAADGHAVLPTSARSPDQRLSLVAVAAAPGLAAAFRSIGVQVVEPALGERPSVGEIAGAILATGAREVILLPNDRDAHMAAGQASSMTPLLDVATIPTRNAAEGVVAALVFDPGASMAENARRMEAEAASLQSFTVTVAERDSTVDGTSVKRGQAIALDADRRLLACEDGLLDAAMGALARLDRRELVTIYHGAGVAPAVARDLAQRFTSDADAVEVEVVAGGQRKDRLLVAAE
jgi:DAK2 domain fusion protein YloV